MSKVLILVEGQTEETFIDGVLAPYFSQKGIYLTPILAATKRVKKGPDFKGGIVSYAKVSRDLRRLLGDTSADMVTTMLDYYNLPDDFPQYDKRPTGSCYQRVTHLEQALKQDIAHRKFLPYLALHEFEAMMFVSPEEITNAFPDTEHAQILRKIKDGFNSPEEIDEESPPSKRLIKLFPGYQKPLHGYFVTDEIGITAIRQECSHFDAWLSNIEQLSA